MKEAEEFCPRNKGEWRTWLEQHHEQKESVWVIFYKKSSPKHNLSWSESVDEALCFGWIDSTKRSIDGERFKQYFSKRKPKSNWSKINKEKIKNLTSEGRMTAAGFKSVATAKENGSWSVLDAVENLEIPEALQQEFAKQPKAAEYFDRLSKSDQKIILYWIFSAKRESTKQKRILEIIQNALQGLKPKHLR